MSVDSLTIKELGRSSNFQYLRFAPARAGVRHVKVGTKEDDERAEELAGALLSAVALDDRHQAERVYRTAEKRAERLSPETVRFIATAEHVAGQLQAVPQLEWSPAVIGLCKAVESEVVSRIDRKDTVAT